MLTLPVAERPSTILKGAGFIERVAAICARDAAPVRRDGAPYKRILIPGLTGGEIQFALLGFLAHALQLRGADVMILSCDAALPACTLRKIDHVESACTRWCHRNSAPLLQAARLPHRWYSSFYKSAQLEMWQQTTAKMTAEELLHLSAGGIRLGQHLPRSVESVFKVGRCDLGRADMLATARHLAASALQLAHVAHAAIDEFRPDKILLDDGLKTDWGVFRDAARQRGVPVDVVLGAPRGHALLLEHDRGAGPSEPYPRWCVWREIALTPSEQAELEAYFESRSTRPYEDQHWSAVKRQTAANIGAALQLPDDAKRQTLVAFPNLSWDAAVTTYDPAYAVCADWVIDTVRLMAQHPQHTLIIKTHPAERHQGALDPLADVLRGALGALPANVRLLDPETPITAHDLLALADVALVYTSTVAIEAALLGVPVINSGGGWHAGRGFTTDARTPRDYAAILTELLAGNRPPPPDRTLTQRYAYQVFFRSALPIRHYDALFPNITALHIQELSDLLPDRDSTIDTVCDGILLDAPFERR